MAYPLPLLLAIIFASVFLVLRWRPFFGARPFIKAAMAILLAVYCLQADPPLLLMAAGFGLSALGDYFLDLRPKSGHEEKFFLPGLIAFFAAHMAFVVYLFGYMVPLYVHPHRMGYIRRVDRSNNLFLSLAQIRITGGHENPGGRLFSRHHSYGHHRPDHHPALTARTFGRGFVHSLGCGVSGRAF